MMKGKAKFPELFKKFDAQIMLAVDNISGKLNYACDKLERRVIRTEKTIRRYVTGIKKKTEAELDQAEAILKNELRSKVIMSEWVNGFIARSDDENLDPITFAFARFSLNVCMSYNIVPANYFISSKIHILLVSLAGFKSNIVVGPALMGLFHLSLHNELKKEIVEVGVLPILLKIIAYNKSSITLIQACKLCTSLALLPINKSFLVSSGCFHGLLDLVAGQDPNTDDEVKSYATMSVTNIVLDHDANRSLTIEFDAIRPLTQILQVSKREDAIINALEALANIAYSNTYTSNRILAAHGNNIVINIMNCSDIQKQSRLIAVGLILLANLCNNDMNQNHVGSTNGSLELAIRVCEHARDLYVVSEAANFILALGWRSTANKSRLGTLGALPALMKRIIRHAPNDDEASTLCLEHVCASLASLLMHHPNHERVLDIGGLEELIRICKVYSGRRLLLAASKVIVAMIPRARDLSRYHLECASVPVEKYGALPVLKRVRLFTCSDQASAPDWLEEAITVLSMNDESLSQVQHTEAKEFVDRMFFFRELTAKPLPTDFNFPNLKGLFFSIY